MAFQTSGYKQVNTFFELCFPFLDDVFSSQTRIVINFVIIGKPTFKIIIFFMLL